MTTKNVSLTEQCDTFISYAIDTGQYQDANEVVCEALQLLEERIKLEKLQEITEASFKKMDQEKFSKRSVKEITNSVLKKA